MFIAHLLGLVLSLGSSIFFIVIKKQLSGINNTDPDMFAKISGVFRKMTYIGLITMIITGGSLMTPFWSVLANYPMLHIKFTIILVWFLALAFLGMRAKSKKKKSDQAYFSHIVLMNVLSIAFGIFIVITATLSFH